MKPAMRVSLIIPIYNNAQTLYGQLLQCEKILRAQCQRYEIVICEDKSTDNTVQLLKKYFAKNKNFRLLFHKKNLGVSRTLRQLYDTATYDYIVNYSVDGGWYPEDIRRMLLLMKKKNADILIGIRKKKTYGLYRLFISFFYNFLPRVFFGVDTYDAGSIKVTRRKVLQRMDLYSRSIFFEAEMIIRAQKAGYRVFTSTVRHRNEGRNDWSGAKASLIMHSILDLVKLRIRGI